MVHGLEDDELVHKEVLGSTFQVVFSDGFDCEFLLVLTLIIQLVTYAHRPKLSSAYHFAELVDVVNGLLTRL